MSEKVKNSPYLSEKAKEQYFKDREKYLKEKEQESKKKLVDTISHIVKSDMAKFVLNQLT